MKAPGQHRGSPRRKRWLPGLLLAAAAVILLVALAALVSVLTQGQP